jgi:hypothetical protein
MHSLLLLLDLDHVFLDDKRLAIHLNFCLSAEDNENYPETFKNSCQQHRTQKMHWGKL